MAGEVLLGQEVSVILTEDGQPVDQLTEVTKFSFSAILKILSQGYLGEKTKRYTMVFEGVKGEMDLHIHSEQWFLYMFDIKLKAQRVTPGRIFSAVGLFVFPSGGTANITIPDISFGEIGNDAKSNGDYFDVKLPFNASDWTQLVTVSL